MNATMSAAELVAHVEAKFSGAYRAKAVLVKWDVETESGTFQMSFSRNDVVLPELSGIMYAQAAQDARGNMGAATASHPHTKRLEAPYYVEVM